jgi:hypothetical protein
MRVFISYAHQDEAFVNRLRNDLLAQKIDVYLATDRLAPGDSWVDVVSNAISRSDVVLVAISASGADSSAVSLELAVALSQKKSGKRVIPLLIDPNAQPPFFLKEILYLDMSSEEKYERNLNLLVRTILAPGPGLAEVLSSAAKSELLGQQMELLDAERMLWESNRARMLHALGVAIFTALAILIASLAVFGVLGTRLPRFSLGVLAGGVIGYLSKDMYSLFRTWFESGIGRRREG